MRVFRNWIFLLTLLFAAFSSRPAPALSCLDWFARLWRRAVPTEFAELLPQPDAVELAKPAPDSGQAVTRSSPDFQAEPVPDMTANDLALVLETYWQLLDRIPGGNDPAVLKSFLEAKNPFTANDAAAALSRRLLDFSKLLESRGWRSPELGDRLLGVVRHRFGALAIAERKRELALLRSVPYELKLGTPVEAKWQENGRLRFAWSRNQGKLDLLLHDLDERTLTSRQIDFPENLRPDVVQVSPDQKSAWVVSNHGDIFHAELGEGPPRIEKLSVAGPELPLHGNVAVAQFSPDGAFALLQVGVTDAHGGYREFGLWLVDIKAKTRRKLKLGGAGDYSTMGFRPGTSPQFYLRAPVGLNLFPLPPPDGNRRQPPVEVIPSPEGRPVMWSADGKQYGYHRFEELFHSAWAKPILFDTKNISVTPKASTQEAIAMHPLKAQFAVLRARDAISGNQYLDWYGEGGKLKRQLVTKDGETAFNEVNLSSGGELILTGKNRISVTPIE